MKRIEAGMFKANCIAIINEVQAKHEAIVITKHGKAVAKLIPVNVEPDEIYNCLAGKGRVVGDLV